MCLANTGEWLPVKKTTAVRTSKSAVAAALNLRCPGNHEHCQLESSAPGFGRRTEYLADYQPAFATVLAAALATEETPQQHDVIAAVGDDKAHTGGLIKLLTENKQEAVRVVQRLHRNLGHPSPEALCELLMSRGVSETALKVAREYKCFACLRYKKPNTPSPSTLHPTTKFNEIAQADVFWLKLQDKRIPVLSMVDLATKYQAAAVIYGEKSDDFIHALERAWIRHFGVPRELHTDEGRGWASGKMDEWTTNLNIKHVVAPGEAHLLNDGTLSCARPLRSTSPTSSWTPWTASDRRSPMWSRRSMVHPNGCSDSNLRFRENLQVMI